MKNIIEDICEKLRTKQYVNEEHIRFSLVGRILQEVGSDIWNPKEVFTDQLHEKINVEIIPK